METYRDNEYRKQFGFNLKPINIIINLILSNVILPWLLANNETLAGVVPVDAAPSSDRGMLFFPLFSNTDRECAPDTVCEDAEDGRLTRRRCSPREGDEGEEEDEEHSCRSCHQVFDSASDLSQHKINQCQLTGKQCSLYSC